MANEVTPEECSDLRSGVCRELQLSAISFRLEKQILIGVDAEADGPLVHIGSVNLLQRSIFEPNLIKQAPESFLSSPLKWKYNIFLHKLCKRRHDQNIPATAGPGETGLKNKELDFKSVGGGLSCVSGLTVDSRACGHCNRKVFEFFTNDQKVVNAYY